MTRSFGTQSRITKITLPRRGCTYTELREKNRANGIRNHSVTNNSTTLKKINQNKLPTYTPEHTPHVDPYAVDNRKLKTSKEKAIETKREDW